MQFTKNKRNSNLHLGIGFGSVWLVKRPEYGNSHNLSSAHLYQHRDFERDANNRYYNQWKISQNNRLDSILHFLSLFAFSFQFAHTHTPINSLNNRKCDGNDLDLHTISFPLTIRSFFLCARFASINGVFRTQESLLSNDLFGNRNSSLFHFAFPFQFVGWKIISLIELIFTKMVESLNGFVRRVASKQFAD